MFKFDFKYRDALMIVGFQVASKIYVNLYKILSEDSKSEFATFDLPMLMHTAAFLSWACIRLGVYYYRTPETQDLIDRRHNIERRIHEMNKYPERFKFQEESDHKKRYEDLLTKDPSIGDRIPDSLKDSTSRELILDPIVLPDGNVYSRESVMMWYNAGHRTCPNAPDIKFFTSPGELPASKNIGKIIDDFLKIEENKITKAY